MAEDVKPRIRVPASAKKGEMVEVKTLISHPMESGQRKDAAGKTIPRKIVNRFACSYDGKLVIDIKLEPGISANPYISFFVRAEQTGTLEMTWTDDDGSVTKAQQAIAVA
jgi:sulfur-oxidizing protein SoxZ